MSSEHSLATRLVATGGLMVATLMVTIDMTIANVALPHMQGSLSASPEQVTWVLTSYMVATAIMTPLTGWLANRVGRKRLLLLSASGFVAMSMLCGTATSLPEMVLFRVLQGVAGAALIPITQAALLDLWPMRLIPYAMATWSAAVMAAPVLGPTIGGFLTDAYSWRWVFYINAPLGLLGVIGVYSALPRDKPGQGRPLDLLGLTALIIFIAAFQLMLDRGPSRDWFDSREIWIEAIVALCAFYVFLAQTITAPHPYVDRGLLRDTNYTCGVTLSVLFSATLFSSAALLPTLMQQLLGYSALQSGLISAPRGMGTIVGFMVAPWIAQVFGPRRTMFVGLMMGVAAFWMMSRFDLSMTATPLRVTGVLVGFGQALLFNPIAVISYGTLSPALRNEGAVIGSMLRNLGGSVGIALAQAAQVRHSAAAHEALASRVIPTDPTIAWALPDIFRGASGAAALNAEVTRQGAMIAYDALFLWMCVISLAMIPLILILRPPKPGRREVMEVHAE